MGLASLKFGRRINRHRSTISRELSLWKEYSAVKAQEYSQLPASIRNKDKTKIHKRHPLRECIATHLWLKWSPTQIKLSLQEGKTYNTRLNNKMQNEAI